jgi:anaerobic selenocysteine-containing dehydrogenase
LSTAKSVCALDCPDTCALLVTIDDTGRATKLAGDPAHPFTRGFLCAKVTKYLDREYHPDRLLYPLRRVGLKGEGRFERISWDQALDEIAQRLAEITQHYGSEAILPYSYAGTMGLLNCAGMDRRFFHRLGASRLDRTICATTGGVALERSQGIRIGMDPAHFSHSKLILAWGANILGTNVHLWPEIVAARRNGAKFYVIDPIKNRTGRLADKHFAINPGSDLALAHGIAHVILRENLHDADYVENYSFGFDDLKALVESYTPDRVAAWTGIPADEIVSLAREYATLTPAAIRVNYGVQRSERGGAAVRAIAALPVLIGAWRHLGGGLQLTTAGAFQFNTAALECPDLQKISLGREARLVNMSLLGNALNELSNPPVKAMIVYNSNPAAIAPDQTRVRKGLQRKDLFTVVLEQLQTDTADFADIVLPVTTFLEHTDLYRAYGHYFVQLARPVLPPPGETKSNVEVFRLLAHRMGFTDSCFDDSEDDMIRALLNSQSPFLKGITLELLDQERCIKLRVSNDGDPFLPFQKGEFRTPSKRFVFGAEELAYQPPEESRFGKASHPFELISAKNDDSMNSTFGYRDHTHKQTSTVWINSDDAAERRILNGTLVRVFNERGSCLLIAKVSPEVKSGILHAPSVGWPAKALGGSGVNHLTSQRLTDMGGGPTFYSCLVDIECVGSLD